MKEKPSPFIPVDQQVQSPKTGPNGETIKKIITKIKEDIETVNKVSNQFNTKFLVSESNSVEGSGKIKTKLEKRIVKPEVNRKTGKCTSSPRNLTLLSLS